MVKITAGFHSSAESIGNALTRNMNKAAEALESLSTGKANVNAAAKAIGNKLDAIARSLEAARSNAQQGEAVLSVAEGSLNTIVGLLADAKILATNSASGAMDDLSRSLLQGEFSAIKNEINSISDQCRWNGISLLNGGLRTLTEAGTVAGTTSALVTAPTNTFDQTTDVIVDFAEGKAQSVTVTGASGAYNVDLKVVSQSGIQTFSVTNFAEGAGNTMTLTNAVTGGTISVDCAASVAGITNSTTFKAALDTMFGTGAGGTAIQFVSPSAAFANGMVSGAIKSNDATAPGTYGLSHAAGTNIMKLTDGVNVWTQTVLNTQAQTVVFDNGVSVDLSATFATATANNQVKFTVSTAGAVTFDFQTAEKPIDLLDISIGEVSTGSLGIGFSAVDTESNAKIASNLLEAAITQSNSILATIKAQKNQLHTTDENLGTSIENVNSAKSVLLDQDVAKGMTEFTKNSILGQIANAMEVQAWRQHREVVQMAQGG